MINFKNGADLSARDVGAQWRANKELGRQKLEQIQSSGPQDSTFLSIFQALALICSLLIYMQRMRQKNEPGMDFTHFQWSFFTVFILTCGSDSLQWPFLNNFFQQKGHGKQDIGILLATYFITSGVAMPIFGANADRRGRKRTAMYFGIAAVVSLICLRGNDFWYFSLNRVSSGAGMAILTTAMESWMVSEHSKRGFRQEWLSGTLCSMVLGSAIISLASSAVSGFLVYDLDLGFQAPLDASALSAVCGTAAAAVLWNENCGYGREGLGEKGSGRNSMWKLCRQDKRLLVLAFLETTCGVPLLVVPLLWAPTIIDDGRSFPLGLIFANMAACNMIGSQVALFVLTNHGTLKQQLLNIAPFLVVATASLAPLLRTQEVTVQVLSFCIFQLCAGVLWPTLAKMRSLYVSEEYRGSMVGILKAPSHFITAGLLLWGGSLVTIVVCICFLTLATLVPVIAAFLPNLKIAVTNLKASSDNFRLSPRK